MGRWLSSADFESCFKSESICFTMEVSFRILIDICKVRSPRNMDLSLSANEPFTALQTPESGIRGTDYTKCLQLPDGNVLRTQVVRVLSSAPSHDECNPLGCVSLLPTSHHPVRSVDVNASFLSGFVHTKSEDAERRGAFAQECQALGTAMSSLANLTNPERNNAPCSMG